MRTNLLILWMICTSGCGLNLKDKLVSMPSNVKPYYTEYFQLVGTGKEMLGKIEFGQSDSDTLFGLFSQDIPAGQCLFYGTNYKIELNQEIWDQSTNQEQREILFHELTHCVFGTLDHSFDPNSYMFPILPSLSQSELNQQVIYYTTHLDKQWLKTF